MRRLWFALAVLCLTHHAAFAAIPASERLALDRVYASLGGATWKVNGGWNGAAGSECQWANVTCNAAGDHVIKLELGWNEAKGTIPTEISGLTRLEVLDLKNNAIVGTLPASIGSLSSLQVLNLSGFYDNEVTGPIPPELGQLSNLRELNLVANDFTGSIPSQLGNLQQLEILDLSYNPLSGPIPASLLALPRLRALNLRRAGITGTLGPLSLPALVRLDLGENEIGGALPASIGSLSNLQELLLDETKFSGALPAQLIQLTNLKTLQLYNTPFDGALPNLSPLTALNVLHLYRTKLTGAPPSWIGQLAELKEFSLSDGMTGALPAGLFTLSKLEFFYSRAQGVTGNLADFGKLSSLKTLNLSSPGFPGPLPVELTRATNLQSLELAHMPLIGPVPSEFGNLSKLTYLDLSDNHLTSLPASFSSLVNLTDIRITSTDLAELPSNLGALTNLRLLVFGDSPIGGTIPGAELAKLRKLKYLYFFNDQLDGSIPPEAFSSPELLSVNLQGNRLSGAIPNVGGSPRLLSFQVNYNALTALPTDLASLQELTYLNVGYNEITGPVPDSLLQLRKIDQLILESNHFSGPIPDFRPLSKLRDLRLNANQFSGPIPDSLGQIATLKYVHLEWNKLSGRVPFNVTNLQPVDFFIRDNALYSDDTAVRAWLAARDAEWERPQTVSPTNLSALAQRERSLTLQWTLPPLREGPGGYRIAYSTSANGPFTVIVTTPDKETSSFIVDSLDPSTNYFFQITTVTYPHPPQQNVVVSEPRATLAAGTSQGQPAAPAVVVYRYPSVISQRPGSVGTSELILGNAGDLAAAVTITQSGAFYTVSPAAFTIPGGGSQVVTITGVAQSTVKAFDGQLTLSGTGVPTNTTISVQMIVSDPPTAPVNAQASANRIDVAAPAAQGTTGSVEFRNTGTGTLQGVVTANVPWIIPPKELIVIPPGESRTVTFTIDQSKRPDAGSPSGAVTGTLSLVYQTSAGGVTTLDGGGSTPSSSIVTVVYTVSPPINTATIPAFASNEIAYFVPGVGNVTGSRNRVFISDISIVNVFGIDSPKDIRMFFSPIDPAGATTATNVQALEPNQGITFANVVKTVFATNQAQGTIQIRTTSIDKLFVSANIFNVSDFRGTYGTNIPIFRSDRALQPGQSLTLSGLRRNAARTTYTNIFVQETSGNTATWELEFFDAAGTSLPAIGASGKLTGSVAPFRLVTVPDRVPVGAVSARLTLLPTSGGRIVGYATPVDDESGDFWTVVDWNRELGSLATEPVIIPVAGSVRGALNAFFRTDVSVTNPSTAPASAQLRYFDRRGITRDRQFSLNPRETRTFEDIIGSSFPDLGDSAGYLELTPEGSASVTSRTFATLPTLTGTYGTAVPALPRSAALRLGQSRIIGGLDVASQETIVGARPGTFRTNVGLVEISGEAATVEVTVIYNDIKQYTSGIRVAKLSFDLLPHQSRIENLAAHIRLNNPNVADLRGVQLQFKVTGGDGAVIVYTSSIDNGTADQVLRTQ